MSRTPAGVELETAVNRVRERVGYFQRGKQVIQNVTFYQDDIALLLAAYDAQKSCEADAKRYRWLRMRDWFDGPLCVLRNPKVVLTSGSGLGADCPSRDRLDEAIDAALAGQPAPDDEREDPCHPDYIGEIELGPAVPTDKESLSVPAPKSEEQG